MEGNYNGDYWADRAFPESYRRAFVAAARQIAEHFQAKGWTETLFQGFLNNKNNFKARGWSRGSSPWLLDEPASFQDYWALRYFARAFHEGINQAADRRRDRRRPRIASVVATAGLPRRHLPAAVAARQPRRPAGLPRGRRRDADVSPAGLRPQADVGRDRARVWLDESGRGLEPPAGRLVPRCLVAGGRRRPPLADGRQRRFVEAGRRAVALLSGRGRPSRSGAGRSAPAPIPSIRLKAYRRGQQDVEYLTLWSQLHNEPRWAVGRQVRAALKLAGMRQGTGSTGGEDAGRIDYGRLRPQDLWALRVAIGEALSQGPPRSREQARRLPHPAPRSGPPAAGLRR